MTNTYTPAGTSTTNPTPATATITDVKTTITTTATSGCLNGDKATMISGTTVPTQSAYKPAFSFGIIFNSNLAKGFSSVFKQEACGVSEAGAACWHNCIGQEQPGSSSARCGGRGAGAQRRRSDRSVLCRLYAHFVPSPVRTTARFRSAVLSHPWPLCSLPLYRPQSAANPFYRSALHRQAE